MLLKLYFALKESVEFSYKEGTTILVDSYPTLSRT